MEINLKKGRHSTFNLHAHLVFVTKYRKKQLTNTYMVENIKKSFESVCKSFDIDLIECEADKDHIHLLINYNPKICLTVLINSLKGVSSRNVCKTFTMKAPFWSRSYFVSSCGGAPIKIVRKYIENQ